MQEERAIYNVQYSYYCVLLYVMVECMYTHAAAYVFYESAKYMSLEPLWITTSQQQRPHSHHPLL